VGSSLLPGKEADILDSMVVDSSQEYAEEHQQEAKSIFDITGDRFGLDLCG
jgi:hypothetical protein